MSNRLEDSTLTGRDDLDDTVKPEPRGRELPTFTPSAGLDAALPTEVGEVEIDRTLIDRGATSPIDEIDENAPPQDFVRRPLDLVEATPTDVAQAPKVARVVFEEEEPGPEAKPRPPRTTRPPPTAEQSWFQRHSMLIVGSAFFGIAFFILGVSVYVSRRTAGEVTLVDGAQENIRATEQLSARTETQSAQTRTKSAAEIVQELNPAAPPVEKGSYLERVKKAHARPQPERSRMSAPELPDLPPRQTIRRNYPIAEAPPVAMSLLIVETVPPGVKVEVDGVACGPAPLMLPMASDLQKVEVKLSALGYLEQKLTASRGDGGRFIIKAKLEKDPRYAPVFNPGKFKTGAD